MGLYKFVLLPLSGYDGQYARRTTECASQDIDLAVSYDLFTVESAQVPTSRLDCNC